MNFRQLLAKYVTGNITSDQLPEIGEKGLEEGFDTPSLCILAGLNKNESPFQIEHYFRMTLDELKITLPDKRQAAIEYAFAIVDKIIEGKKDVIEGTREIRYNAIDSYDFFSESEKYCYDSIGFESVYNLIDMYDELSVADKHWQKEKTNQQLMTETKAELIEELKNWKTKKLYLFPQLGEK
jgi:hypothetical protein